VGDDDSLLVASSEEEEEDVLPRVEMKVVGVKDQTNGEDEHKSRETLNRYFIFVILS